MEVKLIINGVDFTPHLKQSGLQQYEIYRQQVEVIARDGTKYRTQTIKRGIQAQLMERRDEVWYRLRGALMQRPATVEYIDEAEGEMVKKFYIENPTASARIVRGGVTYFDGISLTMEEM